MKYLRKSLIVASMLLLAFSFAWADDVLLVKVTDTEEWADIEALQEKFCGARNFSSCVEQMDNELFGDFSGEVVLLMVRLPERFTKRVRDKMVEILDAIISRYNSKLGNESELTERNKEQIKEQIRLLKKAMEGYRDIEVYEP